MPADSLVRIGGIDDEIAWLGPVGCVCLVYLDQKDCTRWIALPILQRSRAAVAPKSARAARQHEAGSLVCGHGKPMQCVDVSTVFQESLVARSVPWLKKCEFLVQIVFFREQQQPHSPTQMWFLIFVQRLAESIGE